MGKTISYDEAKKLGLRDEKGRRYRLKRPKTEEPEPQKELPKVEPVNVPVQMKPVFNVPPPEVKVITKDVKDWEELDVDVIRGQDGLIAGFTIKRIK